MAIIAIKNEPKCKICSSPHRVEIDQLLEKRSRKQKDDEGKQINIEYVLASLAELGMENPTKENVTLHFRRHCELTDGPAVELLSDAELMAAREQMVEDHFGEGWRERAPSSPEVLEFLLLVGRNEAAAKYIKGLPLGAAFEQLIKTVEAKTRRKQDEATQNLFEALGAGIQKSIGGVVREALPSADIEIESEEVVDAS